ncbi:MAG: Ig-like domain-containing protein [Terriglobales bacterium]
MRTIYLLVVLAVAGLLPGCSSGNSTPVTPTLTSISVTPSTASLAAGLTQQFTATGTYSDNTTQNLTATATWSSSNTAVATIAAGRATAVTANPTAVTITATVSGVSGTAALTVTAPVLDSIAVTPANPSAPVGTLAQFTATGTYSDNSTQNLTATASWSSSNTAVATIAAGGLATALTPGSTTITAASGSVSGSTGLSVVPSTLTSIVIAGAPTVTIAQGTTYQFTAWGYYNDGSRRNITNSAAWTSSNTAAATIGTFGLAQGIGGGLSTTITASLNSLSGTLALDVTGATLSSIAVAPSSVTIAPLTTQLYTAIGTFSDASTQDISHDVTWASSTAAATISNTSGSVGVATGVSAGAPSISATLAGVTGSAPLTVSSATLSSIAVTPSNIGIAVGSNLAMVAVGTFSDASTQPLATVCAWSSSATNVATVSENIVTAIANGPATITCTLNGVSGTANLTVEGFTAIAISPATPSLAENTSTKLTAIATLADGSTQDVTSSSSWTSSNPSVATMSVASGSFGVASGSSPGTSTVTATLGGQIGVASLTVTDATLTAIAIKPPNPTITLGQRKQFGATGTFSDGTTQDLTQQVTWTSSDVAVAIINSSGATLTSGTGTATIGAALAGVSDTTTLTVQP